MNESGKSKTTGEVYDTRLAPGDELQIPLHTIESLFKCGYWQYDKITRSVTCSKNLMSLIGLDDHTTYYPEDLLGKLTERDREKISKQFKDMNREKLSEPFEIILNAGTKEAKTFLCSVFYNQENLIKGILSDITIAKHINHILEERTLLSEMLIENSVDMIAAFNNEFRLIAWNKKCEAFFGKSKQEVDGKIIFEIFPHFKEPAIRDKLEQARNGKEVTCNENIFGYPEGYYETFILPLKSGSEAISGILYMIHDVTEIKNNSIRLKQLNLSLQRKNEAYERSNEELAAFSYVASHDLQEPLRKIQTFSQRIIDGEQAHLSETGKEYLKRMAMACERMQVLIDDLLTFSRTNAAPREFAPVDLNQLVAEIHQEIKENWEDTGVEIHYNHLPVIEAIPFQFKQLLENLLLNSIKYHKPGVAPVIHIEASEVCLPGDGKNYHKITITDNGIGFEQEYAERIFELFQRLHGKHEYPGTGLGLAICKKIVENHKGQIMAEGKPGQGAIFTVYIPVQIEA